MKKALLTLLAVVTFLTTFSTSPAQVKAEKLPSWIMNNVYRKPSKAHLKWANDLIKKSKNDHILFDLTKTSTNFKGSWGYTKNYKIYYVDGGYIIKEGSTSSQFGTTTHGNLIMLKEGKVKGLMPGFLEHEETVGTVIGAYKKIPETIPGRKGYVFDPQSIKDLKNLTRSQFNEYVLNMLLGITKIKKTINNPAYKLVVSKDFKTIKYFEANQDGDYNRTERKLKFKNGKLSEVNIKTWSLDDSTTTTKIKVTYGKTATLDTMKDIYNRALDLAAGGGWIVPIEYEDPRDKAIRLEKERLEKEKEALEESLSRHYNKARGMLFSEWSEEDERKYNDFFTNYGKYKKHKKIIDSSKDIFEKDMKILREYFDKHRQDIVKDIWNRKDWKKFGPVLDKYPYYLNVFDYIECLVNVEEGNPPKTSKDEESSSEFSGSNLPDDYNEETDEDWENDGE